MSISKPSLARLALAASALVTAVLATVSHGAAEDDPTLDEVITGYMIERGAAVQLAPDPQLARRYAIDLTGVVPTAEDIAVCEGRSPAEMFDYFRGKPPMAHTRGDSPYVWANLIEDADHFLFSNSPQFGQVRHIRALEDRLRRVYADGESYADFARWALESQYFLARFPSGADRANAAFFLFLGRDSLASEVAVGRRWNGWVLRAPDLPASAAEDDPDYHAHDWDPSVCESGAMLCEAELWGVRGSTPAEAIEQMVGSTLFAEAVVDRYWERYVGEPLPGVDFPIIRRVLVRGLRDHGYDVNWLIREIATSPAYTQEMMFR